MKVLKWSVISLVVVVAAALVALMFWGGQIVKESVNRVGPRVLGVPVRLEQARFYPFRGHVGLSGMVIGNPEGFNTESLFEMQSLEIDLNLRSLFSDTIVIERILIEAPQITYEVGMRKTNLGVLLESLEGDPDPDHAEKKPPARKDEETGKQLVIKELILADARAQVSATSMRGRVVPVQLPTITLNDLGGEDQSLTQIVAEVLKAVLGAVGNAVAGAGSLLGEGLTSALEGVETLGGMTGERARDAADSAGEGMRAVAGAIDEGIRGLRGLTGEEAKEDRSDSQPAIK